MSDRPESVDKKVAALREAFGNAYIEDARDGEVIVVQVEGAGTLLVGDMSGPLGHDDFRGHSADLHDAEDGDYLGTVLRTEDSSLKALIEGLHEGLRQWLRNGD
jgi:hypothetical protein